MLIRRISGAASASGARPARLRGRGRPSAGGAGQRAARAGRPRGPSRLPCAGLSRRARPARRLGPGHGPAASRRPLDRRCRRMGDEPGLRLWLRGPDGSGVAVARGAVRASRGACVDPLRAGAPGLLVAHADRRRSRIAGRGVGRRAAAARRGVPAGIAGARRAPALRRRSRCRAARRLDPLARGRRVARDARAGRGGRARGDPRGDAAARDRGGLSVCGSGAPGARHGLRLPGSPGVVRVARGSRHHAVRLRAPVAPSLCVGRRRSARAIREPSIAVLRACAEGGRLDRGPSAREGNRPRRPRCRGRNRAPRGTLAAAARHCSS